MIHYQQDISMTLHILSLLFTGKFMFHIMELIVSRYVNKLKAMLIILQMTSRRELIRNCG